jgi:hypothetical protein
MVENKAYFINENTQSGGRGAMLSHSRDADGSIRCSVLT